MHTHTNSASVSHDFLIERGPDCLVVVMKAAKAGQERGFANFILDLLSCHSVNRLVIEFYKSVVVTDPMLQELAELAEALQRANGLLKICGLPTDRVLDLRSQPNWQPSVYEDRQSALLGDHPRYAK